MRGKKGIFIAPLAMALIVVIIFFILMAISPDFKQAVLDFLSAIFGNSNGGSQLTQPPPAE